MLDRTGKKKYIALDITPYPNTQVNLWSHRLGQFRPSRIIATHLVKASMILLKVYIGGFPNVRGTFLDFSWHCKYTSGTCKLSIHSSSFITWLAHLLFWAYIFPNDSFYYSFSSKSLIVYIRRLKSLGTVLSILSTLQPAHTHQVFLHCLLYNIHFNSLEKSMFHG